MIKMIAGVYGLTVKSANGSKIIKGMGPDSGSFSVSPEEEARLVNMGVAQYVQGVDGGRPFEELTVKELRELGKKHGLTFKIGMTKAEMAAAIRAKMEEPEPDVPDIPDAPPAEDDAVVEDEQPESAEVEEEDAEPAEDDAPTFDAAEAVL